MVRKVTLAWIADDTARRTSLKKRRLGLLKKVSELTTLCGTQSCVIIYSPDETEPMVWPSHSEVELLLREYRNMPELEKLKKMTNQETYLKQRVSKAEEQLRRLKKRNQGVEMSHLIHKMEQGNGIVVLNNAELHGLTWLVEEKMKQIRHRIEIFNQPPFASSSSSSLGHHHGDPMARVDGGTGTNPLQLDQWFFNMMNNNEHAFAENAAQDMELLPLLGHSFGGTSSLAADMRLPLYGDIRGATSGMGQPPMDFMLHGGGATDMGMPRGSFGSSSTFGSFGHDRGMGGHLCRHIGSNGSVSEPGSVFWPFGGGDGASSDTGMQIDGKSWPDNFSP